MKRLKYHPSLFTIIGSLILFIGLLSPLLFEAFKVPLFFLIIGGVFTIITGNTYLINLEKNISQEMSSLNLRLKRGLEKIDTTDLIIKKINLIYEQVISIHSYLSTIDHYYFDDAYFEQRESIQKEITFILRVLTNLRSDLQLRLEEQKNSLEQAKYEVEKNIQGTTELEQVSELQKARLDQQIEQFEELQRILVTQ